MDNSCSNLPVGIAEAERTGSSRLHLGRLDDFCSFPKADVATPTSIGQVWDKSVIRDHARERQVSVEADVRGFAAIVPGMNNLGR